MSQSLYLGFDGGQSGSRAVVADRSGTVLGIGAGPVCEHVTAPDGYERNRDAIHGAIGDALTKADASASDVTSVGMGLTGAPPELDARPVFQQIVREIVQPEYLWIDHDAATNLAGATAGAPGVVVIAGSGSIAYGINESGAEGRAGGLGYLMGDEGSAWWIGISALKAAAAAADGRGPETAILPFVLNHFNLPTIRHIHTFIYAETFRRTMVSDIAVEIARMAQFDTVAHAIMKEAGQRLAIMVLATIRQIHAPGDTVDVYPTGGVFRAGEIVMVPFTEKVMGEWPEIQVMEPQFEPVIGALIRAYQQADNQITPSLLQNVRRSLR